VHEGGANVVTEALALGVPVISSHIPGSTGLLGTGYPATSGRGTRLISPGSCSPPKKTAAGSTGRSGSDVPRCGPSPIPARERGAWAALLAGLGFT
jgi:hypothetical protein